MPSGKRMDVCRRRQVGNLPLQIYRVWKTFSIALFGLRSRLSEWEGCSRGDKGAVCAQIIDVWILVVGLGGELHTFGRRALNSIFSREVSFTLFGPPRLELCSGEMVLVIAISISAFRGDHWGRKTRAANVAVDKANGGLRALDERERD